jgi:sialate O-acetylesterase
LSFRHAESGLMARGDEVRGLFIAGADREWHPAAARVEGENIVVSSPGIGTPVEVRYGWANHPECNIYNRAGLPLAPFRTDTWN